MPYLEHHRPPVGGLLHKQLVRCICNAVLISITIAMGDSNKRSVANQPSKLNRLKLLIHNWYCSFHAAQH